MKIKSHYILNIFIALLVSLACPQSSPAGSGHDQPAAAEKKNSSTLADLPPDARKAITDALKRDGVLAPEGLVEQARLTSSDGVDGDGVGNSVAISGDVVVVGAPSAGSAGAAYVFLKPAGGWSNAVQNAKLVASDGATSDSFGQSVAIEGDTVVVGSLGDDIGSKVDQGSAYVFVKPAGGWSGSLTESAKLTASDGGGNDAFGGSVALAGDTVVVGSAYDDIGSKVDRGSAYVFIKPAGGWSGSRTENAKLTASDGAGGDYLGGSVAISGDTIATGASGAKIGSNLGQGASYIFKKPAGGWVGSITESAKLVVSNGLTGDGFGGSVAIADGTVVSGAPGLDGVAQNQGAVYVFIEPVGGWSGTIPESAKLSATYAGDEDFLGSSVAIEGDTIVAGAPTDPQEGFSDGAAYVFVKPAGGWVGSITQSEGLSANNGEQPFGASVAISGGTVVAGSPDDYYVHGPGAAYIFEEEPSYTGEGAKLTASDGYSYDRLGLSAVISGDTIAVGATGAYSGFGTFCGGAVYVYLKPAGGWSGSLRESAKLAASEMWQALEFGGSVAMSGDTIVVSDTEVSSKRCYVFVKPAGGWSGFLNESATLTTSDLQEFGSSVAMAGDTVVVGASRDRFFQAGPGAAYVFVQPSGGWSGSITESAKLTASDGRQNDYLGGSVAMSGDAIVAGAYGEDVGSKVDQGAAYVFVQPVGGWSGSLTESAKLIASDGASRDNLGGSVAINGDSVVAGAPAYDVEGNRGSAYVFVKPAGGWAGLRSEDAKLTVSNGAADDNFGGSVAIETNTIVVGAPNYEGGLPGSAFVFLEPAGGWSGTLTDNLTLAPSDGETADYFGGAAAVNGGTIVVGAFGDNFGNREDQGSAYVFPGGAPTVTSISPSSKTAAGVAFTLTVNGTNFLNTSVVQWNGSARSTTFVNSTKVTAAISASDIAIAGLVPVTVLNPPPGGGTSNAINFTINNPVPKETSLSPSSITAGGTGFTLTITGTSFVSTSVVQWNGSARPTTFVNSTKVTAAITASDIANGGVVLVTVMNPAPGGGTSPSKNFNINNPGPTATSLAPNNATAGGATFTLTVNGTNFVPGSVVIWKGASLTSTFVNSAKVTASVPAANIATAGTVTVTVSNPKPGGGTSNPLTFSINNPLPAATVLKPSTTTAGGAAFTLKVTGTGFVSDSTVKWNGRSRTTTFVSRTVLNASILATDIDRAGTAAVTVFNRAPGGGTSNALTFTIQ